MTHQLGNDTGVPGYVDKRRAYKDDFEGRIVTGPAVFTANAGGTTTTIVGANAAYPGATATNVVRIGDEFKLFTTAGALKQETVFRITNIAVAASTTVTFTPAAAVATASGDNARLVNSEWSAGEKDRKLTALGFSATRIATLTENDKDMQIRVGYDPGSI